jgi:hypothetical protein
MTFRIFGLLSVVFSDTDFTGTVTGAVPSGATAIDGAILLQVFLAVCCGVVDVNQVLFEPKIPFFVDAIVEWH